MRVDVGRPHGAVLAIDAGQSGIRVRLDSPGTSALTFAGVNTARPLVPQLADVVRRSLSDLTVARGSAAEVVTAGVSGLTDGDRDAEALIAATTGTGIREVRLAHDSVTSYIGARGLEPGAVIAAGTGVVTLAVGRAAVARVDGWGHIMGDAGSGWWIGREALDAVMRAFDGRGPQTSLTRPVREVWPELPLAYVALQAAANRVALVASFARAVDDHAQAGDAVAQAILRRAAAELAHSVASGLRTVGFDDDESADVCAIGGVFASALLRASFVAELTARWPSARLTEPRGAGIDGAARLAAVGPGHPLAPLVHIARVG